ncbi:MAG: chemotaxis protein CheB [Gemmatimonadaceae bacterium]
MTCPLVIVGTSWGGLSALRTLVAGLGPSFAAPLLLVQHRHKESTGMLGELLQSATSMPVIEIEDKQPIEPRHVFVAPPDYHVLVDDGHFSLTTDPLVRFSRPSIDVTLESAAEICGPGVIGAILTGANDDGARGLRAIVDAGGTAFVQDPDEAEMPIMPLAAFRAVPEARVLPLAALARALVLATQPRTSSPRRTTGRQPDPEASPRG